MGSTFDNKRQDKREIIDIENIENEYKNICEKINYLEKRFYAVALDYKDYIDYSWKEQDIFNIRDNLIYRLFSIKLHSELVLKQHLLIENRFEEIRKDINYNIFNSDPTLYHYSTQEISSIFDSFIYHLASIFDYLSTMINYMFGDMKKKQDTIKWNNLVNFARDKTGSFLTNELSECIVKIDNKFVCNLYTHRSFLIHQKSDLYGYISSIPILNESKKLTLHFIASRKIIKRFAELKNMSNNKHISIKFIVFWLLNNSISSINELLFKLKDEILTKSKGFCGMIVRKDENTGEFLPASSVYWNEIFWKRDKK
jgi:hypothetical protein